MKRARSVDLLGNGANAIGYKLMHYLKADIKILQPFTALSGLAKSFIVLIPGLGNHLSVCTRDLHDRTPHVY